MTTLLDICAGIAVFCTFCILSDLVWYALLTTAVGAGSSFYGDGHCRFLIGGCAVVLVGLGFYFFRFLRCSLQNSAARHFR